MKEIRLSKSVIGQKEIDAVSDVLRREYLGMGREVKEFEDTLTSFFSRPTLCVNTGTSALQLALQAAEIGAGDEVLVQSLTFVASFQAISATGATPVPCEIFPETITLDLNDAERKITERTKAIMPVHYASGVGNLDEIYAMAQKYNLRVIEDAAHAFGTTYKNKLVGSFGDIACFSFDGIKNITSGEGGAVVTNDTAVLRKVSDARLLGVERDAEKRYAGERSWEFDVTAQGWRYHLSNILAAIGIEQLKKFPLFKEKRQLLAKLYQTLLSGKTGIELLNQNYDEVVPHIFIVRLTTKSRDEARNFLSTFNIQTGLHYLPSHLLTYYNPDGAIKLPVTESIFSQIFTLPLHPDLSEEDVRFVCEKLLEFIEK